MKNSQLLQGVYETALKTGNVPYKANIRALKAINLQDDGERGLREINLMLAGLRLFIEDLEELKNVSQGVAKRASAVLR